jgi:hypothetical protein
MAGRSRSKNGGASARLYPAIHLFSSAFSTMDHLVKPGDDD